MAEQATPILGGFGGSGSPLALSHAPLDRYGVSGSQDNLKLITLLRVMEKLD